MSESINVNLTRAGQGWIVTVGDGPPVTMLDHDTLRVGLSPFSDMFVRPRAVGPIDDAVVFAARAWAHAPKGERKAARRQLRKAVRARDVYYGARRR